MEEISNRALIALLVTTIFLSTLTTVLTLNFMKAKYILPEITGKVSGGNVEVNIGAMMDMEIPVAEIDFGSGAVNRTMVLSTEQINPDTFNPCIEINGTYQSDGDCRGIQIENVGNVYINLSMSSSEDGNSLFLGDNNSDEFSFTVVEGNLSRSSMDSCKENYKTGKSIFPQGSNYDTGFMNWTPVVRNQMYGICNNLSFSLWNRSIVIEINVTVPYDEGRFNPGEQRVASLYFVAQSAD